MLHMYAVRCIHSNQMYIVYMCYTANTLTYNFQRSAAWKTKNNVLGLVTEDGGRQDRL